MMRALTGLLVVLLLAAPVAAPTPAYADTAEATERDGPLPRLDRVGPLQDPADVEAGRLSVVPAVTEVVVAADRRREVRHVVANTTDHRLHLDVDVVEATATPDGPGPGRTGPVGPDEPVRLVVPVERLVLDPGEGAVVVSTAQADAGASGVFALRVRSGDEAVARGHVVVAADDGAAAPELALDLRADGAATLTVTTPRPAVVDVRLTGRSWLGSGTDQTVADLIVGPEGRELSVPGPTTRWPGPVRVAAYATAADGEVSAEAGRLVVPLSALLVGALFVLLGAAVWWRRRTRHRSGRRAAVGSAGDSFEEER